jgi:hypothetical protein
MNIRKQRPQSSLDVIAFNWTFSLHVCAAALPTCGEAGNFSDAELGKMKQGTVSAGAFLKG